MSNVPNPWSASNMHQQYHNTSSQPKQAPVTIYTLFPNIDRWALGYDTMLDNLKQMSQTKNTYPPYNILKNGDDYTIEMALAGFRKEDVEVNVHERNLTVRSDIDDRNYVPEEGRFGDVIHHGIAQRNFTTNFALGEYVEVVDAQMTDGILTIKLETHIPEDKKPKVIEVK
jgi:molecular chaperone IbpA